MAPVLGYWNIRGLAEQYRLLLHYLGVEYEEKLYEPGLLRIFISFELGLAFPNLPYYIDGDFKLMQSSAILEYIADAYDMVPSCKKEHCATILISKSEGTIPKGDTWATRLGSQVTRLTTRISIYSRFLTNSKSEFPKLKAYLKRFENLPTLKDYLASPEFKTRPCNSVPSKWRGDN
ncbi:hypothetical protein Aperf_G00000053410 [Anoplocephala perfoliata]